MIKRLRQTNYLKLKANLNKVVPFFVEVKKVAGLPTEIPTYPFDTNERCRVVLQSYLCNLTQAACNKVIKSLYDDHMLTSAQYEKLIIPFK